MKLVKRILAATLVGAALLGAPASRASNVLVCNGDNYTWPDDFLLYKYLTAWPAMMTDCSAQMDIYLTGAQTALTGAQAAQAATQAMINTASVSPATQGTSTTSMAIGVGSKSFTIQTSKSFLAGMPARLADQGNPTVNYMDGVISSYNSTTGATVFNSLLIAGSGTVSAWNLFLEGAPAQLPSIASGHLVGNGTGSGAPASDTTVTALLDAAFGSTVGTFINRQSGGWAAVQSPVLYTQFGQTVISSPAGTVSFTGINATDAKLDFSGMQVSSSGGHVTLAYTTNNGSSWVGVDTISPTSLSTGSSYNSVISFTGLKNGFVTLAGGILNTNSSTIAASNTVSGWISAGAQINGFQISVVGGGSFSAGTITVETR